MIHMIHSALYLLVKLAQHRSRDLELELPKYVLGTGQQQAFETGFEQGIEQMCALLDTLLREISQA